MRRRYVPTTHDRQSPNREVPMGNFPPLCSQTTAQWFALAFARRLGRTGPQNTHLTIRPKELAA